MLQEHFAKKKLHLNAALYENEILETRPRQGQLPSPRLSYPLQVTQGEGGNIASSSAERKAKKKKEYEQVTIHLSIDRSISSFASRVRG
jgi:hypothetical protein